MYMDLIELTLTISVIRDTSAPSAVSGAPSLLLSVLFKCLLCDMNNELKALVHALMFAKAPAAKMPPIIYNAKRKLSL